MNNKKSALRARIDSFLAKIDLKALVPLMENRGLPHTVTPSMTAEGDFMAIDPATSQLEAARVSVEHGEKL